MPTHNVTTVLILVGTWITVHATVKLAGLAGNKTEMIYTTGLYDCPAGHTGSNCTEECPDGSYGKGCAFDCSVHCVHKSCNPTIGNCTFGCEYGWVGVFCKEDILTPEELEEKAIIMFFQFIAGIMGFYLMQIAVIKYRSLKLGCCCCCKYCPCNRKKRKQKKLKQLEKLEKQKTTDASFMVELEPLKCDNKCLKKQVVHVV